MYPATCWPLLKAGKQLEIERDDSSLLSVRAVTDGAVAALPLPEIGHTKSL